MTWETFDADWTDLGAIEHPDLPCAGAWIRDDGIRLEFYDHGGMRIVEVSDDKDQTTFDVIVKAVVANLEGGGRLIPIQGFESVPYWHTHPTIAVAALRYAERVWPPRKAEE